VSVVEQWVVVLIIIFVYLAITLAAGIMASLRREFSVEEYVAASRSLGPVVMYFLMGASIFSAFAFLGGPGWAFGRGAASFYILGYCALGLLPWYIFGPKALRLGKSKGYVTQAQLASDRFKSPALSAIMALVSVLAFIQYITLQMKGIAYVFNVTTGGVIPFWAGALIAYGVVFVYVFLGGVRSVAWTNVLQGIMMVVLAWSLGLYLPYKLHGGPAAMFQKIAETNPGHLIIGPEGAMSYAAFSSAILVSVLGFAMWPHLFMRAYNAESEATLKKSVMLYPTFAIFMVPVLFIGFSAIGVVPEGAITANDQVLPWMVTNMGFSPLVVGLFAAGTMAAAMSSADAITHGAASVYTIDFHKAVLQRNLSDKATVWVTRIAVVIFCSAAYYLAIFGGQSLVALLLGAYGSIVQFFPIVVAAFYWPRATAPGAIAGLLGGVFVNYAIQLKLWTPPIDIHSGIWGLILNVVLLVVVSYLTKPMEEEHVRSFVEA